MDWCMRNMNVYGLNDGWMEGKVDERMNNEAVGWMEQINIWKNEDFGQV